MIYKNYAIIQIIPIMPLGNFQIKQNIGGLGHIV